MSDLAAQLAAKFNTDIPLGDEPAASTSQKADPRAAADPDLAKFAALVHDVTGIPVEEVQREKSLRDTGVDSLHIISIVVRTEEATGVMLDDADVAALSTIGEFLDLISQRRS
ncbi:acyl carrier protein [Corynebacterium renale]|uniref:acyl carrier protein n=1 Tax=Corynebacterium renale TaxID=1724 RepID=UPI000DA2946B|nr:acyl carrier protein [Corynebacterium renale]SQG65077.1 acyl carrier protein [Corynebacterium renale]